MEKSSNWKNIPPDYIAFLFRFPFMPYTEMKAYSDAKTVSGKLFGFSTASTVVSLIIAGIAKKLGAPDDPSIVLGFFGSLDRQEVVVVQVLLIAATAAVTHGVAQITSRSNFLGGSLNDTLNAAFGFGAFIIPFITLCISALLVLVPRDARNAYAVSGLILAFFFIFYWSSALAATHPNTSRWQAFIATSAAWVTLIIFFNVLAWLLS